jgi:hypothetical protein
MKPLSTKQYALLRYMTDYRYERGQWATAKDIAYNFDVRRECIYQRIQVLAKLGYVRHNPKHSIEVLYMPGMGDIRRAA